MTEKEYRQHEGISRSQLWKIRESPEKFKYAMEHPEDPTPALLFGTMVHKLVLEPDTFDEEFIVAPEVDRRTKEGKAAWAQFEEDAAGRQIVKLADFQKAYEMVVALQAVPMVQTLLAGQHEVPLFWTDELTGEPCKVRLDILHEMPDQLMIVDYKSTNDATTEAFIRSAINYGYDFQTGMYIEGVRQNFGEGKKIIFIFIAQEKEPPYAANILIADELIVKRGFDTFRELLGIYHYCKETGNWYGYLGKDAVVNTLGLPAWLAKEIEQ